LNGKTNGILSARGNFQRRKAIRAFNQARGLFCANLGGVPVATNGASVRAVHLLALNGHLSASSAGGFEQHSANPVPFLLESLGFGL
jgi:hypothetical protein